MTPARTIILASLLVAAFAGGLLYFTLQPDDDPNPALSTVERTALSDAAGIFDRNCGELQGTSERLYNATLEAAHTMVDVYRDKPKVVRPWLAAVVDHYPDCGVGVPRLRVVLQGGN